ncbi:uncharacterized protein [Dermacentor albipictus]|uniref:uncharacterized protein isoform X2 n=1 Tax=Dermacentor albipictus TaxID=60249 RepID=UPI0038FCE25E
MGRHHLPRGADSANGFSTALFVHASDITCSPHGRTEKPLSQDVRTELSRYGRQQRQRGFPETIFTVLDHPVSRQRQRWCAGFRGSCWQAPPRRRRDLAHGGPDPLLLSAVSPYFPMPERQGPGSEAAVVHQSFIGGSSRSPRPWSRTRTHQPLAHQRDMEKCHLPRGADSVTGFSIAVFAHAPDVAFSSEGEAEKPPSPVKSFGRHTETTVEAASLPRGCHPRPGLSTQQTASTMVCWLSWFLVAGYCRMTPGLRSRRPRFGTAAGCLAVSPSTRQGRSCSTSSATGRGSGSSAFHRRQVLSGQVAVLSKDARFQAGANNVAIPQLHLGTAACLPARGAGGAMGNSTSVPVPVGRPWRRHIASTRLPDGLRRHPEAVRPAAPSDDPLKCRRPNYCAAPLHLAAYGQRLRISEKKASRACPADEPTSETLDELKRCGLKQPLPQSQRRSHVCVAIWR